MANKRKTTKSGPKISNKIEVGACESLVAIGYSDPMLKPYVISLITQAAQAEFDCKGIPIPQLDQLRVGVLGREHDVQAIQMTLEFNLSEDSELTVEAGSIFTSKSTDILSVDGEQSVSNFLSDLTDEDGDIGVLLSQDLPITTLGHGEAICNFRRLAEDQSLVIIFLFLVKDPQVLKPLAEYFNDNLFVEKVEPDNHGETALKIMDLSEFKCVNNYVMASTAGIGEEFEIKPFISDDPYERLVWAMKSQGVTQKAIAAKLKTSTSKICRILKGLPTPNPDFYTDEWIEEQLEAYEDSDEELKEKSEEKPDDNDNWE